MKKLAFLIVSILVISSCSKERLTDQGPTDVRIKNLSDQTFTNVMVKTSTDGDVQNLGTIEAGAYSDYFRFDIAYPKAEITVTISGNQYTTGAPDYTYETYIGPDMITYEVFISDDTNRELEIFQVILEGPIQDL